MKQNEEIIPVEVYRQLHTHVNQANHLLTRLTEVLNKERDALSNHQLDSINDLSQQKISLMKEIDLMRQQMLNTVSTPDHRAQEQQLNKMVENSNNKSLQTAWHELTSLLKRCRLKNEKNGAMIGVGQMFSQQLLDILKGVSAQTELYGSGGQKENMSKGNLLIHA